MKTFGNIFLLSLLSLSLASSTACKKNRGQGGSDGGTDAGTDAGPPPPPERELVPWHLFGDMPIDNGVLDPQLTMSGFGWFAMTGTGDYVNFVRRHQARTPTGQPILQLPKNDVGDAQVYLAGMARAGQGPRVASIWVGRLADRSDPTAFDVIEVDLLAYDADSKVDGAFLLGVDDGPEGMVELDGILWQHRSVQIDTDLFGWALLTVSDISADPLFVTGPVLAPAATRGGLYRPGPPAHFRPELRAGERLVIDRVRAALRERFEDRRQSAARAEDDRREGLGKAFRAIAKKRH